MDNYLKDAFKTFGEPLTRSAASPALKDLLYVDMGSSCLSADNEARFKRVVGILQWSCKRGRPDVDLAIAFFTEQSGFLHNPRLEEITPPVEFFTGHNQ